MNSFNEAWDLICEFCKTKITGVAYKTWIDRIEPVELDFEKGKAVLMAPNEFHRQTLTKCYLGLINSAFSEIFGSGIDICFIIPEELKDPNKKSDQNLAIDSRYEFTFDTYIVGSSNKFAHAAALAVAANPAGAYNPLFIYGNSGLGKTHLLYAIANDVKKSNSSKVCLYIKGDDFTNQLIDSIRNNSMTEFHQKYREADVLLVDDIQFIAGKDSTQEEFFHTFNELYSQNKQIVLSADCHPKEIELLSDRLKTRFEGGLMAQVLPPDIETKIAILQKKAELRKYILSLDVALYLAEISDNDVRSLEGMLNKVIFASMLHEEPITLELAKEALNESAPSGGEKEVLTTDSIIDAVCNFYKIQRSDLLGKKKTKEVVEPRQICAYLMTELLSIPLVTIGQALGGRDHTTVIHARDKISELIKENTRVNTEIKDLKNMILKK